MVHARKSALGGAANVAANVSAIGARCRLVGVIGDDTEGALVKQEMAAHRLEDRFVLEVAGRPTTSKTRVVARSQQVVRIDEEITTPIAGPDLERLIAHLHEAMADADALLLEDYNKGALTPEVIKAAMEAARRRAVPVIVDPKPGANGILASSAALRRSPPLTQRGVPAVPRVSLAVSVESVVGLSPPTICGCGCGVPVQTSIRCLLGQSWMLRRRVEEVGEVLDDGHVGMWSARPSALGHPDGAHASVECAENVTFPAVTDHDGLVGVHAEVLER